jgi:hypothetical protein
MLSLQVRLVIIDEIHLLHDSRGPVLESIVARTIRYGTQLGHPTPGLVRESTSFNRPAVACRHVVEMSAC